MTQFKKLSISNKLIISTLFISYQKHLKCSLALGTNTYSKCLTFYICNHLASILMEETTNYSWNIKLHLFYNDWNTCTSYENLSRTSLVGTDWGVSVVILGAKPGGPRKNWTGDNKTKPTQTLVTLVRDRVLNHWASYTALFYSSVLLCVTEMFHFWYIDGQVN